MAILSKEPDAPALAARIEGNACFKSPLVVREAVRRLTTKLDLDPLAVELEVQDLIDEARIDLVTIDRETARLAVPAFAVPAFAVYRNGRGHPARLNIADCLSHACAKALGVGLLYQGADFSHTDLAS